MIVWRDGELIDAAGAISADDRGWLIGDAVFETVLVERGIPAFLERHLSRLALGCAALRISYDLEAEEFSRAIRSVADRNALVGRAACRLTISRTGGPRGLAPSDTARAQLIVSAAAVGAPPDFYRLLVSGNRRRSDVSTNGFKCVGAYAENMIARADAQSRGADEAIMLNEFGRVACATSANIFLISNGVVRTPPATEGAMPGVVRGVLLEEAVRLGIQAMEAPIEPRELSCGALLLTNSIAGAVRSALSGERDSVEEQMTADLIAAYVCRLEKEFNGRRGGSE